MPKIDLVDAMTKPPGRCGICNTTPTSEGAPLPAIDTNVDVDWGNNLYICIECCNVIADLMGRVEVETHEELRNAYDELKGSHKNLRQKFRQKEDDLQKVIAGRQVEARRKKRKAIA